MAASVKLPVGKSFSILKAMTNSNLPKKSKISQTIRHGIDFCS
jgi:hypothetical protein